MKRTSLDTDVLPVFRLFIGGRLILAALSLLPPILQSGLHFDSSGYIPVISVLDNLLLLFFLFWPWLRRRMGKAFLPFTLIFASVVPLLENLASAALGRVDEVRFIRAMAGQWQLIIVLSIPLILVAWHYSLRVVTVYCLSLALVDVAGLFLVSIGDQRVIYTLPVVVFRTLIFIFLGYVIGKLVSTLRDQNRQLASYASTLEQLTISRERNRLAREFHDTVAHTLSAVAVQLEAVSALSKTDPERAQTMLDQSLVAIRSGLTETRRSIQSLRATPLEELGLARAIRNLVAGAAERYGLPVDLIIADDLPALGPDVEHSLYRITEEALRNVAQHAQATRVSLRLESTAQQVVLMIHDDGVGFDTARIERENRFGLRGMAEYADSVGAALKLASSAGKGTTVDVVVEVNNGTRVDL
jgi:signal transduction histidine kinase